MPEASKQKNLLTNAILNKASLLGFDHCGISKAGFLEKESVLLKEWLRRNHHGEMKYMENNFGKRCNPRKLVKQARSVISVLYNYYSNQTPDNNKNFKISRYAYGRDYHIILKDKLHELLAFIKTRAAVKHSRVFVDSAPVLEKAWAVKAGLGWVGKNTCLINRQGGSYFFIGELIIDLELTYNTEIQKDLCGGCTRCIRACPTGALSDPYTLDSRKCISYLTIEYKNELPAGMQHQYQDWIFGCDICQEVCPWNKSSVEHKEPEFNISEKMRKMTRLDWEKLTKVEFELLFKDSPVQRTSYAGLKRNINYYRST